MLAVASVSHITNSLQVWWQVAHIDFVVSRLQLGSSRLLWDCLNLVQVLGQVQVGSAWLVLRAVDAQGCSDGWQVLRRPNKTHKSLYNSASSWESYHWLQWAPLGGNRCSTAPLRGTDQSGDTRCGPNIDKMKSQMPQSYFLETRSKIIFEPRQCDWFSKMEGEQLGVVAHSFSPALRGERQGVLVSLRPARTHSKNLSQKIKKWEQGNPAFCPLPPSQRFENTCAILRTIILGFLAEWMSILMPLPEPPSLPLNSGRSGGWFISVTLPVGDTTNAGLLLSLHSLGSDP